MHDLLFLAHRLPYPPNKGDKIRSFNILQHLAQMYRVHLGAFVDDPDDWRHVAAIREICSESCIVQLNSTTAKWRSLEGLITRDALTLPYYRDAKLQAWVDSLLGQGKVKRVWVSCSAMAQYVTKHLGSSVRSIMDFIDVDSAKWLQYSDRKTWPISWLYRREHTYVLRYEQWVASKFSASIFVSRAEAALFKTFAPESANRITYINNGVDTNYFSPARRYSNPYPIHDKVLVFTGAMDYWPNVDAVCWFATEVFSAVHKHLPAARFYITGARPVQAVRNLARQPGVRVTGRVPDVRPYLAHACAAVAPLRIAQGVQNKVLEAMAMAKPVIATRQAMAGIDLCPALEHLVADGPADLMERAIEQLNATQSFVLGKAVRQWVLDHYNWDENLRWLEKLLEGDSNPLATNDNSENLVSETRRI
jgi:sugar transferase (PEP-CTERM/EpsH1 system associated)